MAWCWEHPWEEFIARLCGLSSRSRFMELLAARQQANGGAAATGPAVTKAQSANAPSLVGQYKALFAGKQPRRRHSARNTL